MSEVRYLVFSLIPCIFRDQSSGEMAYIGILRVQAGGVSLGHHRLMTHVTCN